MKKKQKKIIRKVIEFSIYIFVAYFIYDKLGGNISQVSFEGVNLWILGIAVLVFSLHSIWNALTWNFLIRSAGHETVTQEQMSVYLRSYIMRYSPGNIVGIFSRGVLNQPHGVPMFKSIWGWFLENILYLGIGILLGLFALRFLELNSYLFYGVLAVTILIGGFVLLKNDLLENIFEKYIHPRLPKKYKGEFASLSLDLRSRLTIGTRYLIAWVIYSVSFLLVVVSAGVNPLDSILMYAAINAIAYSIGYLALITPSGIGIREGVMIFLLGAVVGLSSEQSVIIAVLARIVFILGELLAFGVFYLVSFGRNVYEKKV